jgi:hypothetical protein
LIEGNVRKFEESQYKGLIGQPNFGKTLFQKSQVPSWGKLLGEEEKQT